MPLIERMARISDIGAYEVEWTTYWPINGRVPRINPQTGEVTGRIK
jgi:hypothetical protein